MEVIAGGYKKIEFDDDDSFGNPTEIKLPLKIGTWLQPLTMTEEFADGTEPGTLKEMDVSIRSADMEDGPGSAYERLKDAEENRKAVVFRFWTVGGEPIIVYGIIPYSNRNFDEFGKFNALEIFGIGVAINEETLLRLGMDIEYLRLSLGYKGLIPKVADLSWVNQETATAEDTSIGLFVIKPVVSAAQHLSLLVKPISGDFTITVAVSPFPGAVTDQHTAGLALRDSSTGRIVTCVLFADGNIFAQRYNSPTSINSNIGNTTALTKTWLPTPFWLRIRVTPTLRISDYSFDGIHFGAFNSIARNDFLANIDQCGLVINNTHASIGNSALFKSLIIE